MDQRIKNVLGVVGIIAIALGAIAVWNGSAAFSRSAPPGATFSVSGQGKAVGTPDVAQFAFSVVTEGDKDVTALQMENTNKANAAIEFVKSQGVEAKDIETIAYDIQPRYQNYDCRSPVFYDRAVSSGAEPAPALAVEPCPPPAIVGYTVSQTVQVKMRDFTKTGDILSGVADKGANAVFGMNFTLDDPAALQNEARGKAIQDAKEQAKALAEAGGFRLGRLVSVNESGGYLPYNKSFAQEADLQGRGGSGAPLPAPNLEPGSEQVTVQVNLVYEIR